jgi:hypothetical protein
MNSNYLAHRSTLHAALPEIKEALDTTRDIGLVHEPAIVTFDANADT